MAENKFNELDKMVRAELEEQCIIGLKVYGKCKQQDCLVAVPDGEEPPEDSIKIDPAKSNEPDNEDGPTVVTVNAGTTDTADWEIVASGEGEFIDLTAAMLNTLANPVKSVKVLDNDADVNDVEITIVSITNNMPPSDYWEVTLEYKFIYKMQLLDAAGNVLDIQITEEAGTPVAQKYFQAYSTYTKTVMLCGGLKQDGIYYIMNFGDDAETASAEEPKCFVQAKRMLLPPVTIGTYEVGTNEFEERVCVTIGLMTIIKLFRLVNMLIEAGPCTVDDCESYEPGDPCTFFKAIEFPMDEFDPPLCTD